MRTFIKAVMDSIAFFLSIYFSSLYYSKPYSSLNDLNIFLVFIGWIFFIFCIINNRGYTESLDFSKIREATSLVNASITMVTASIVSLFIFNINIPQFVTINSRILFIFSLVVLPIVLRGISKVIFSFDEREEAIVLIGIGELGKAFLDNKLLIKKSKINILGIFDDKYSLDYKYKGFEILGGIDDLESFLSNNKIKRVLVAIRHISEDQINKIELITNRNQVFLSYLPSIESFRSTPEKLKDYAGIPVLSKNNYFQSAFYRVGKRIIDLLLAIFSLILSFPFWLIVPLLIKKDSEGPVFFKQERIGKNGVAFTLYKFRSMYLDTPKFSKSPISGHDPRITKTGRWLRKTSLDELPQLFNVLNGSMSMVGPRPEMPFIVDEYNRIEKQRLIVRPGLTGLWQISPYRNTEINHNLEYDFYYIQNQGFILDFLILVMTSFFALRGITS